MNLIKFLIFFTFFFCNLKAYSEDNSTNFLDEFEPVINYQSLKESIKKRSEQKNKEIEKRKQQVQEYTDEYFKIMENEKGDLDFSKENCFKSTPLAEKIINLSFRPFSAIVNRKELIDKGINIWITNLTTCYKTLDKYQKVIDLNQEILSDLISLGPLKNQKNLNIFYFLRNITSSYSYLNYSENYENLVRFARIEIDYCRDTNELYNFYCLDHINWYWYAFANLKLHKEIAKVYDEIYQKKIKGIKSINDKRLLLTNIKGIFGDKEKLAKNSAINFYERYGDLKYYLGNPNEAYKLKLKGLSFLEELHGKNSIKSADYQKRTYYTSVIFEGNYKRSQKYITNAISIYEKEIKNKKFSGVGFVISKEGLAVKVVSVLPNSPAEISGIEKNDLITHIDGENIGGNNLDEVVSKIKGPENSNINLTIIRKNSEPMIFRLERKNILDSALKIQLYQMKSMHAKFLIEFYGVNEKNTKYILQLINEGEEIFTETNFLKIEYLIDKLGFKNALGQMHETENLITEISNNLSVVKDIDYADDDIRGFAEVLGQEGYFDIAEEILLNGIKELTKMKNVYSGMILGNYHWSLANLYSIQEKKFKAIKNLLIAKELHLKDKATISIDNLNYQLANLYVGVKKYDLALKTLKDLEENPYQPEYLKSAEFQIYINFLYTITYVAKYLDGNKLNAEEVKEVTYRISKLKEKQETYNFVSKRNKSVIYFAELLNVAIDQMKEEKSLKDDTFEKFLNAAKFYQNVKLGENELTQHYNLQFTDDVLHYYVIATTYLFETYQNKYSEKILETSIFFSQLKKMNSVNKALTYATNRFIQNDTELSKLIKLKQDNKRKIRKNTTELISLSGKLKEKQSRENAKRINNKTKEYSKNILELDKEIKNKFPKYVSFKNSDPLKINEIRDLINKDEALLNISTGQWGTFCWLITKKGIFTNFQQDFGENEILILINKMRPPLNAYELEKFDLYSSNTLYKKLFSPFDENLVNIKKIFVVTGGALESIPFSIFVKGDISLNYINNVTLEENLKDLKKTKWLHKDFNFVYLPSIYSLKSFKEDIIKSKGNIAFLGFGDPVLPFHKIEKKNLLTFLFKRGTLENTNVIKERYSRIPETKEELINIAEIIGSSKKNIFLGKNFTEKKVKETDLSKAKIIAFATHGEIGGKMEGIKEPFLVATPPDKGNKFDDGIILASEISQLQLDADLVILSACNTSAGVNDNADQLSGLVQSFFYAGTRSLLITHWEIESVSAKELVSEFFLQLKKNKDITKSEALSISINSLQEKDIKYNHPFFWAPFIVVGDDANPFT